MPPYNSEAPDEAPESRESCQASPVPSIIESFFSESPLLSENEFSSSESDYGFSSYSLSAPGYEKIKIPLEQNLKELLIKVTETNNLETVTKIRLRVIARDFSLQRLPIYMPQLTELNLDGSALLSLRDLGCDMNNLKILHVCRCGLNSLDGLLGLQNLVELYAANNNIDDLCACSMLAGIEKLDLRNNRIQDMNSVTFLSLCTTLRHLFLEGCPTAEILNYRRIVKGTLPDLLSLDDIPYTEEDRVGEKINEERTSSCIFPPIHDTKKDLDIKLERPTRRPYSTDSVFTRPTRLIPLTARPSTARRATANDFSDIDGSELKLRDVYALFVPSVLTSGKPLCGSPAVALRDWKRMYAWEESPQHNKKLP